MKFSQTPAAILMIRPASFGFNSQTASSNAFQEPSPGNDFKISQNAVAEFDRMVDVLRAHDVEVLVVPDTALPEKPDAVFPNNWISFHCDGNVCLYPMMAENRRLERLLPVLEAVKNKFHVQNILDFSVYETEDHFLEGTGSVVFDYQNKIAYACRSARTHESVLQEVCKALGYSALVFDAVDENGQPIYHTNVLMCVGTHFAVVCLDAIKADSDQELILNTLAETNHQVVAISYEQLRAFAGNMIEVATKSGEPLVLLSERAYNSLLPGQLQAINKHAEVLPVSIPTIEQFGGGSVRCMVAGIFCERI